MIITKVKFTHCIFLNSLSEEILSFKNLYMMFEKEVENASTRKFDGVCGAFLSDSGGIESRWLMECRALGMSDKAVQS